MHKRGRAAISGKKPNFGLLKRHQKGVKSQSGIKKAKKKVLAG